MPSPTFNGGSTPSWRATTMPGKGRPPLRIGEHGRLHLGGHLMRTARRQMGAILKPLKALRLIASQPSVQRLPRHPHFLGDLRNRQTITNHGLIPLLSHAQLPHLKECQGSAETAVKDQPKHSHASPGTEMSNISRGHTPTSVPRQCVPPAGLEPATTKFAADYCRELPLVAVMRCAATRLDACTLSVIAGNSHWFSAINVE
jgi:hypothetical protein